MSKIVTAILTAVERDELTRAIVLLAQSKPDIHELLPTLPTVAGKLASATEGPAITVGVHGGLVQWVIGNPFPIRICDYDGDDDELQVWMSAISGAVCVGTCRRKLDNRKVAQKTMNPVT